MLAMEINGRHNHLKGQFSISEANFVTNGIWFRFL